MELLSLTTEGLYCAPGGFYIDPWRPVDTAVITHGHGDHAHPSMGCYVAVDESVHILGKRLPGVNLRTYPYGESFRLGDVELSFHPAGHILGSSQVRLAYRGEVWVFSGDFKRDADPTCRPFEVVPCDVFISEATFALPVYRWPDFRGEVRKIYEWWQRNRSEGYNSVVACYALGKAQRLIAGLRELTDEPLWVHGTIDELNHTYARAGLSWPLVHKVPLDEKERLTGALVLCPPAALGSSWSKRLTPKRVGFASGWMRLRGNRRRKGYERGFVISDHADWPALLRTVTETGARRVLFTHGNTDAIVRYLREKGIEARDLKLPYELEEDA
jgi:putative mRNA 3-end processing factor